jgi:hypothetical protein
VHFHLLTDDARSENELRKLLKIACERCGLFDKTDFRVDYDDVNNGYWYFEYFAKYDRYFKSKRKTNDRDENEITNLVIDDEIKNRKGKSWDWTTVVLFQKGLRIQKFYTIGQWFAKGRGKGKLWKEIQQEMKSKDTQLINVD